jgi:hypothetical protein
MSRFLEVTQEDIDKANAIRADRVAATGNPDGGITAGFCPIACAVLRTLGDPSNVANVDLETVWVGKKLPKGGVRPGSEREARTTIPMARFMRRWDCEGKAIPTRFLFSWIEAVDAAH